MKKLLLQTFLGILTAGIGVCCMYFGIQGLQSGKQWFFLPAVLCIGIAIYFFFQASKSDSSIIAKPTDEHSETTQSDQGIAKIGLNSMIDRNNTLAKDWEDINNKKDKLRMLEISASAEEQSNTG